MLTRNTWTKEKEKEYHKQYYIKNKDKYILYRKKNSEHCKQLSRNYRKRLRIQIFTHYGMSCKCCNEAIFEFLTIDHINGGGNKHRKSIKTQPSVSDFYRWIIKNNFPSEFQTLCMNCNHAKGKYGYCPHKELLSCPNF